MHWPHSTQCSENKHDTVRPAAKRKRCSHPILEDSEIALELVYVMVIRMCVCCGGGRGGVAEVHACVLYMCVGKIPVKPVMCTV